jgi:hypothetical protein
VSSTGSPVVKLAFREDPKYPDETIPPEVPSLIITGDVPLTDTPWNITVIFLTQLGIPVKSIAVPLVDATAVPEVIEPPFSVEELIVAPENVDPVITPLALIESTSAVVAPLLPLASLIVPSGEDGTERVKFWVAVADWPI